MRRARFERVGAEQDRAEDVLFGGEVLRRQRGGVVVFLAGGHGSGALVPCSRPQPASTPHDRPARLPRIAALR